MTRSSEKAGGSAAMSASSRTLRTRPRTRSADTGLLVGKDDGVPQKPSISSMEAYLGRAQGLVISLTGIVSASALDRAQHLIDHGEPAEGMVSLAWAIVNEDRLVPSECVDAISDLAD